MKIIENLTFMKTIENLTFVKSDCYYQSKMPGCETTIFASVTGEVGAPANSQFRVNSFLPTLYCYADQDGIGISIENRIDSGIGPSLAAHRSL